MVKARQVDEKRRVILPPEIEPGSDVLIERIDQDSWMITKHRAQPKVKVIYLPILTKLPKDDPAWDKVERAFTRAASRTIHRPDFE